MILVSFWKRKDIYKQFALIGDKSEIRITFDKQSVRTWINQWMMNQNFKTLNFIAWPFVKKELPENIRWSIINYHKTSNGYKAISNDLSIPISTVRNVIKIFAKYGIVKNHLGRKNKGNVSNYARRQRKSPVLKKRHKMNDQDFPKSKLTIHNRIGTIFCYRRKKKWA